MNEILISTYNIWLLILVGCFYLAFPPRGQVTQRDVGLINLFAGFFGILIALMLRSRAISGQIIESFEFSSTITGVTEYWLFLLVTIALTIIFLLDIAYYFKQRVTE